MKHRIRIYGLVVMAAAAAAVAATGDGSASRLPASAVGSSTASWDNYRILVTRNIFLQDRSQRTPSRSYRGSRDRYDRGPVERVGVVLTGIGQQGPDWLAFLEDTRSGKTFRVTAGETLQGGLVVAVTLDGIEYRSGGTVRRIAVGQTLTGTTASLGGATSQPAQGSTSQPATSPATQPASRPATEPAEEDDTEPAEDGDGPATRPAEGGPATRPVEGPLVRSAEGTLVREAASQPAANPQDPDQPSREGGTTVVDPVLERLRQRRAQELKE